MRYLTFRVGNAGPDSMVEVTLLGSESDVFLVDDLNLAKFKRGQNFRYTGGHYDRSPVRLGVPHHANWTAVVVPNGQVRAQVRLVA